MFLDPRRLRLIILIIVATCPTISYASELCSPKAQEEECRKYTNDSGRLKFCNEVLKSHCERNHSFARAPSPERTVVTAKQPTPPPPPPPPVKTTPLPPPQFVFIRADRLDNPYPGLSISSGQALGASVSYTNNDFVQSTVKTKFGSYVTDTSSQSVAVTGLASLAFQNPTNNFKSWLLVDKGEFGGENVLFMPSLWVSANGNWDHPTKAFGDTSALKVGPELDFLFVPQQGDFMTYFGVAPFYQTDFYSQAQAEGVTLSWTPSYPALYLMQPGPIIPGLVDGFLELRAEATYLNVGQPGHTLLRQGSYEWLGGAARSYIFFFTSCGGAEAYIPPSIAPYIVDQLSFIGTYQGYWDANSRATADIFSAALQYKIGACDTSGQMTVRPGEPKAPCTFGAPSITFQYDTGMDRDTLQYMKKFQVKLSYAW